jgi:hypothetical protein
MDNYVIKGILENIDKLVRQSGLLADAVNVLSKEVVALRKRVIYLEEKN